MPRPGPRRPNVGLKLDPTAIAAIDRRALDEGLTIRGGEPHRSEALRLLIAYGLAHMPPGWRPEQAPETRRRSTMTTWTAPADTALSADGINHVVAGLTDPDSRYSALTFLDRITDVGLLYLIAGRLGWQDGTRSPSADRLRDFITGVSGLYNADPDPVHDVVDGDNCA